VLRSSLTREVRGGHRVEDLVVDAPIHAVRKSGPAGKLQKALELAKKLPKRQQSLALQFVETQSAEKESQLSRAPRRCAPRAPVARVAQF